MKHLLVLSLSFFSLVCIAEKCKEVKIVVRTEILIAKDNALDLMDLIHEDGKALSKKYLKEQGVKSVETEVQNQTLIKKYSGK